MRHLKIILFALTLVIMTGCKQVETTQVVGNTTELTENTQTESNNNNQEVKEKDPSNHLIDSFTEISKFHTMNKVDKAVYITDTVHENNKQENIAYTTIHLNNILSDLRPNATSEQQDTIDKFLGKYNYGNDTNTSYETLLLDPGPESNRTLKHIEVSNSKKEVIEAIRNWLINNDDNADKKSQLDLESELSSSIMIGVTNRNIELNWRLNEEPLEFTDINNEKKQVDALETTARLKYVKTVTSEAVILDYKPDIELLFILPINKDKEFTFNDLRINELVSKEPKEKLINITIPKLNISKVTNNALEELDKVRLNLVSEIEINGSAQIEKLIQEDIVSIQESLDSSTIADDEKPKKDEKINKLEFSRPFGIVIYDTKKKEITNLYKIVTL